MPFILSEDFYRNLVSAYLKLHRKISIQYILELHIFVFGSKLCICLSFVELNNLNFLSQSQIDSTYENITFDLKK